MMHADGISYEGDVLDLAMAQKLVVRSGPGSAMATCNWDRDAKRRGPICKRIPALVEELRGKIAAAGEPVKVTSAAEGETADEE